MERTVSSAGNAKAKLLEANPAPSHACVVGDQRPFNVALLVVDKKLIGGRDPNAADFVADIQVKVDKANASLSRVEQIKKFAIVTDEWRVGGDEITPTMKLRRNNIATRYFDLIDGLYKR